MGERKVLNKYIPPDFDPSKIPRSKKKDGAKTQSKIRMMLPMSICCNTCGNYITKGTKFNARKEDAIGEEYLGLKVFRFYFRCSRCSAEIAMKTDPKNADYVVEAGAKRNFEPWREKDAVQAENDAEREREEAGDTMKQLENRTKESKREMDITAALDEMRSLNARQADVASITQNAIHAVRAGGEAERRAAEDAEAEMARRAFRQNRSAEGAEFVRRLDSDDDDDDDDDDVGGGGAKRRKVGPGGGSVSGAPLLGAAAATATLASSVPKAKPNRFRPKLVVAKKPSARTETPKAEKTSSDGDKSAGSGDGLGLLGILGYGSDS